MRFSPPSGPDGTMRPVSLSTALDAAIARAGRIGGVLLRYLIILVTQATALIVLAGVFVSISVSGYRDVLIVIGVGAGTSATVLPTLMRYAVRLKPVLFPLISFVLNAWVLLLLDQLLPGFRIDNWMVAGITAAVLTAVAAFAGSFLSISDDAAWRHYALDPVRARYVGNGVKRTTTPGFVFLEIDGLSEPTLREAMAAGYAPNMRSWLEIGTHRLTAWETDLSSQTSASQAGILLGVNHDIPGFRWYDRELGRVVVSNTARDAAMLQAQLSTGKGLLADGGASRGNLFSGDAPDSLFTFATLRNRSVHTTTQYYAFYSNVYNLARTMALFVSDIFRELVAASWQVLRNERPRIRRFGVYPLVRAASTSILRELNTFTIAGDMLRGVPAMYTTYVAYDEVAHHSGILRGDALRVLRQIDRDIGRLARVAAEAPRPYHLVVLSDHGQTQGAPFRQRYGETLAEVVSGAIHRSANGSVPEVVHDEELSDEGWEMVSVLLTDFLAKDRSEHPVVRRALRRRMHDGEVALRSDLNLLEQVSPGDGDAVVVLASGNLGLISFTGARRRLTIEDITHLHRDLIPTLVEHSGIGFVLVETRDRGPLAIGRGGMHALQAGKVGGNDPLAPYSPNVPHLLREASGFRNAPDILVVSAWWTEQEEVAAFEELVGSHGGLGGGQTMPFVLSPVELDLGDAPIVGATSLHKVLKGWVAGAAATGNGVRHD